MERGTRNVERTTRNTERGTQNTERGTHNAERGTHNAERGTRNVFRSPHRKNLPATGTLHRVNFLAYSHLAKFDSYSKQKCQISSIYFN